MKVKMYLHGDKETNFEQGKELGLTGQALDEFCHALYEVEFDVAVNMQTGETTIVAVDGKAVEV